MGRILLRKPMFVNVKIDQKRKRHLRRFLFFGQINLRAQSGLDRPILTLDHIRAFGLRH